MALLKKKEKKSCSIEILFLDLINVDEVVLQVGVFLRSHLPVTVIKIT